jgi:hypothetical protein
MGKFKFGGFIIVFYFYYLEKVSFRTKLPKNQTMNNLGIVKRETQLSPNLISKETLKHVHTDVCE